MKTRCWLALSRSPPTLEEHPQRLQGRQGAAKTHPQRRGSSGLGDLQPCSGHHPRQRAWCGVYLAGLLQDGERKTIEPLSRRVSLPPALAGTKDPDQGLQQFVSASAWDEGAVGKRYRVLMAGSLADPAGVFVLDDTTFGE